MLLAIADLVAFSQALQNAASASTGTVSAGASSGQPTVSESNGQKPNKEQDKKTTDANESNETAMDTD